ncbi:MAG: hypothetical protein KJ057_14080 [Phycisphaerae bacterium]|nr:MAG: hypothetical protein EDS66_11465 [Planctomycetota bacterium]KAB2940580.1 MAG: hypothetical protein F9K17_13825 [Phycisphaerae bacterium]MBE7458515.1 hypothetical protein [Planctomycetia bacterium]MCK6465907.1 hypothetical protein [Phycisphaerae bacterium]MCL4719595.1 hypothetical protein [Phycisphaerae bacterium]
MMRFEQGPGTRPDQPGKAASAEVDVESGGDVVLPFRAPQRCGRVPGRREIFAALIDWELRHGDLNRPARRRLVQYAAQLGFSAAQAGSFIRASLDRIEAELGQESAAASTLQRADDPAPLRFVARSATREAHPLARRGPLCILVGAVMLTAGVAGWLLR